jgi:hypothetical protein
MNVSESKLATAQRPETVTGESGQTRDICGERISVSCTCQGGMKSEIRNPKEIRNSKSEMVFAPFACLPAGFGKAKASAAAPRLGASEGRKGHW